MAEEDSLGALRKMIRDRDNKGLIGCLLGNGFDTEEMRLGESMGFIEEAISDALLYMVYKSDKRVIVRLTNSEKSYITESKETLALILGKQWEETIHDLQLPLIEYQQDKVKILLSSKKAKTKITSEHFEVYAVEVVTLGRNRGSLSSINIGKTRTMFLAVDVLLSGQKVGRLGKTVQKAIDSATEALNNTLIKKLGI